MSFIDQLQNFFGVGNNLLQAGESALEGAENSLQNAGQQVGDAFNNCSGDIPVAFALTFSGHVKESGFRFSQNVVDGRPRTVPAASQFRN